jgi:hypothetical protein
MYLENLCNKAKGFFVATIPLCLYNYDRYKRNWIFHIILTHKLLVKLITVAINVITG